MAGSIFPGCSIDAGVYRPRRCSREHTWPVTNTDPCGPSGAGLADRLGPGLSTVAPVAASVRLTGTVISSGIVVSRLVAEGEEPDVGHVVVAVEQCGSGGGRGGGHRAGLELRQRYPQHEELLLPGQP